YGQPYAYPYVVVQQQPYAPAARSYPYVIHRPQAYTSQPYAPQAHVRPARRSKVKKAKLDGKANAEDVARPRQIHREVSKADPALIEELRRKTGKKIDKTIIVREKPVVIERK